jgi:hypothetical protein
MTWLGDTNWESLVGVSKRRATAAPTHAATAFDPTQPHPDPARRKAWLDLRALLVGEGAYTPAGAAAFGPLLAKAAQPNAAPLRLWTLLLDLLWGPAPISARGIDPAITKKGPGAELLATARGAQGQIEALLTHAEPVTRAGAALVLGALRAPCDALVQALAAESDDAARAAMLLALAGAAPAGATQRAREGLEPPAPPLVRLAAATACLVLEGAAAPDLARDTIATFGDLRGDALPLPAGLGWVAQREALAEPRARLLLTDAVLQRVDRVLDDRERSKAALSAAIGDLSMLLGAWLPKGSAGPALPPIARRVVERTLHLAFAGRPHFEALGLPAGVPGRRRWLGLPGLAEGAEGPLREVLAWEEAVDETPPVARATLPEVREALRHCPPSQRQSWARAHLSRRSRWPGATRAPNQEAALLALEQLEDAEVEGVWLSDREAVLAALTGEGPEVLALLGRLPKPRRIDAWRQAAEVAPNPVVNLRKALALAPACPFPEVAQELLAWTFRLPGGPGAAPLDALWTVLDGLGEAGLAARAGLTALSRR